MFSPEFLSEPSELVSSCHETPPRPRHAARGTRVLTQWRLAMDHTWHPVCHVTCHKPCHEHCMILYLQWCTAQDVDVLQAAGVVTVQYSSKLQCGDTAVDICPEAG